MGLSLRCIGLQLSVCWQVSRICSRVRERLSSLIRTHSFRSITTAVLQFLALSESVSKQAGLFLRLWNSLPQEETGWTLVFWPFGSWWGLERKEISLVAAQSHSWSVFSCPLLTSLSLLFQASEWVCLLCSPGFYRCLWFSSNQDAAVIRVLENKLWVLFCDWFKLRKPVLVFF